MNKQYLLIGNGWGFEEIRTRNVHADCERIKHDENVHYIQMDAIYKALFKSLPKLSI